MWYSYWCPEEKRNDQPTKNLEQPPTSPPLPHQTIEDPEKFPQSFEGEICMILEFYTQLSFLS